MAINSQLCLSALIATRVGSLVLSAPALSSRVVPIRMRLILAATVCLLVVPVVPISSGNFEINNDFTRLLAQEAVVGLSLGLGLSLVFQAVQLGIQTAGQMVGIASLGEAEFGNPSGAALGQFLHVLAIVLFLLMGGHLSAIDSVLDTFQWLPAGQHRELSGVGPLVADLLTHSFSFALRVGAPIAVAVLVATMAVASVGRSMPQLSHFTVGANLNLMVMLAAVWLSLGVLGWMFHEQVDIVLQEAVSAWSMAAAHFRPGGPIKP